jgi:prepilin-type N-terminal cleavage/methylation domain-containing protein
MNYELRKTGLTMIEILIAVAILALLAGGIFLVGGKAKEQAKIELTKSTMMMLDTALEQYYDYGKTYPPDVNYAAWAIAEVSRMLLSPRPTLARLRRRISPTITMPSRSRSCTIISIACRRAGRC